MIKSWRHPISTSPLVFAGLFVLGLRVALYVIFSATRVRGTGWATRKTTWIAT